MKHNNLKNNKMKHKQRKTSGVQGTGSDQFAEYNSGSNYKKETSSITKSNTGNSVLKGEKMKHKNKKTTGVKASGSGQSPENISGETNNIQSVIPEEGLRPRNILIDYDTNMDDLYQELLKESYKRYPSEITLYVVDAREFSLEDIENLSKMINKSKLIVNLNAVGCIDFTELTLFALWVTGEVNFPCCSNIHMESNISIPKNNLNRISKKISKRIGVEANLVSRLYKQKSIVEPNVIFPEF